MVALAVRRAEGAAEGCTVGGWAVDGWAAVVGAPAATMEDRRAAATGSHWALCRSSHGCAASRSHRSPARTHQCQQGHMFVSKAR